MVFYLIVAVAAAVVVVVVVTFVATAEFVVVSVGKIIYLFFNDICFGLILAFHLSLLFSMIIDLSIFPKMLFLQSKSHRQTFPTSIIISLYFSHFCIDDYPFTVHVSRQKSDIINFALACAVSQICFCCGEAHHGS